jgi:hypothetical protein
LFAAVIAGLAAGIAFMFVMAFTLDSVQPAIPSTGLLIATNGLAEVRTFLDRYPDYNATVYLNPACASCRPPIVEYSHQEGTKYADIRIIIDFDYEILSKYVRCANLEDTFDSVEIHGQDLERQDILNLLQDPHCP